MDPIADAGVPVGIEDDVKFVPECAFTMLLDLMCTSQAGHHKKWIPLLHEHADLIIDLGEDRYLSI